MRTARGDVEMTMAYDRGRDDLDTEKPSDGRD